MISKSKEKVLEGIRPVSIMTPLGEVLLNVSYDAEIGGYIPGIFAGAVYLITRGYIGEVIWIIDKFMHEGYDIHYWIAEILEINDMVEDEERSYIEIVNLITSNYTIH